MRRRDVTDSDQIRRTLELQYVEFRGDVYKQRESTYSLILEDFDLFNLMYLYIKEPVLIALARDRHA